jgi:pyridoxine 4-dehydrogenase
MSNPCSFSIGGELAVRRMGFGAMELLGPSAWGDPTIPDSARRVLTRAVDLGVNLIDTAAAYGPEINERLIAETLAPYPLGMVIATKGGIRRGSPAEWLPCGRPDDIKADCEASLRRLKLERIDLYQLHTVDPSVRFEDTLGALAELQDSGKVRFVGLCNVNADQLASAKRIVPIASVQNRYNLVDQQDDELVTLCEREGIAFLPWGPLCDGALAGSEYPPIRSGKRRVLAAVQRRWPRVIPAPRRFARGRAVWSLIGPNGALSQMASQRGVTPSQVALAWLLRRSPCILPIPGTSSIAHLEDNMASLNFDLTHDDFNHLSRPR